MNVFTGKSRLPSRFHCLTALLCSIFSICGSLATALAQTPAPPSPDQHLILLGQQDNEPFEQPIIDVIREALADLPVVLDIRWIDQLPSRSEGQTALVRQTATETQAMFLFWNDPNNRQLVHFYINTKPVGIFMTRQVDSVSQAALAEELALMVRSLVKSILRGETLETSSPSEPQKPAPQDEMAESSPKETVEPQERVSPIVSIEAAYSLGFYSAENLLRQGIYMTADFTIATIWHVFAGYSLLLPLDRSFENGSVSLSLRRHPIVLGARVAKPLGRVSLSGAIGLGIDYITSDVKTGPTMDVADNEPACEVSFIPMVRIDVTLIGPLHLFGALGAMIPVNKAAYETENAQGQIVSLSDNWPVRPHGWLGVRVDLF